MGIASLLPVRGDSLSDTRFPMSVNFHAQFSMHYVTSLLRLGQQNDDLELWVGNLARNVGCKVARPLHGFPTSP